MGGIERLGSGNIEALGIGAQDGASPAPGAATVEDAAAPATIDPALSQGAWAAHAADIGAGALQGAVD
ncbi:MAG TPA: hypothetical protein VHF22_00280, partial [Planctomycetota bacterium]|nr:hypothetical protein [Planctomycetota bacterium]